MGHIVSRENREINGHKMMLYPNWVDPDYFQTMQIPLLLGRTFHPGEKHSVIVSQTFACWAWGSQNPLGQIIPGDDSKDIVVGVVGDVRNAGLQQDPLPQIYTPYTILAWDGITHPRWTMLAPVSHWTKGESTKA